MQNTTEAYAEIVAPDPQYAVHLSYIGLYGEHLFQMYSKIE